MCSNLGIARNVSLEKTSGRCAVHVFLEVLADAPIMLAERK